MFSASRNPNQMGVGCHYEGKRGRVKRFTVWEVSQSQFNGSRRLPVLDFDTFATWEYASQSQSNGSGGLLPHRPASQSGGDPAASRQRGRGVLLAIPVQWEWGFSREDFEAAKALLVDAIAIPIKWEWETRTPPICFASRRGPRGITK